MPLRFERDSYANAIVRESFEFRQLEAEHENTVLDSVVEFEVQLDVDRAPAMVEHWTQERISASVEIGHAQRAGDSEAMREAVKRFSEAYDQVRHWEALAELAS